MKFWKSLIRVWFTVASLVSFLIGWSVLAHAPKPNQFNPSDVPAMPRLEPVPTLNQVMLAQQSQSIIHNNRRVVVMRSGGS